MEQNLEKIFLEKDSGAGTHAYPLWTQLGISRKFLREAHEHVINSGLCAGISAQNLMIIHTAQESREILCERTWRESVYTPPLARPACLLD